MFLGLSLGEWITIGSVVVPLIAHSQIMQKFPQSGGLPVIGGFLNALLGIKVPPSTPATPVAPPVVAPTVPVLANHPVLNEILTLALKQFLANAANPSGNGPVVAK